MGRSIGGVILGMLVAGLCVAAIEYLGILIFPPPEGMDPMNADSIRQFMPLIPRGAMMFILVSWIVGPALGAWVASRVTRSSTLLPGLAVGGVFLGASIYNLLTIPHPLWFAVAAVVLVPIAVWFGARAGLVTERPAETAS